MTTTTLTKTPRTLVASGTSNAAAGVTRAALDLQTAQGGLLTLKISNGPTGPTMQALCNILVAHKPGATPLIASAGLEWKTLWSFGGGTTALAVTEQSFEVSPAVMHLEVEFIGNTGQAVTVEAYLSEIINAVTV